MPAEDSEKRCRCLAISRCWPLQSSSIGEVSTTGVKQLTPKECQQVAVDLILMRRREAVRRSRIVDFLRALNEPGRFPRRVFDRNDLVVLTVQDERWYVELFQILRLVRFRECLDTFVGVLETSLHAPEAKLRQDSRRGIGPGPVGAIEKHCQVLVEL